MITFFFLDIVLISSMSLREFASDNRGRKSMAPDQP